MAFAISWAPDATRLRGPWCIVTLTWSLAFAAALYALPLDANKWTRCAIFALLGWRECSCARTERCVDEQQCGQRPEEEHLPSFGGYGINLGGLAGAQLFQEDALRYHRAFLAINLLYAASIVIALVIMGMYWGLDRKAAKNVNYENAPSGQSMNFDDEKMVLLREQLSIESMNRDVI